MKKEKGGDEISGVAIWRACVRLVAQPLLARTPSVDPVGLGGLGGLILILVGAGELALRIFGGAGEGEDRQRETRGRHASTATAT